MSKVRISKCLTESFMWIIRRITTRELLICIVAMKNETVYATSVALGFLSFV